MARGKYFARMDADDWNFPDRLLKQFEFLEKHEDCGVVSGTVEYVSHKSGTGGFQRYVNWSNNIQESSDIYLKRFMESPVVHPTVIWRKEVSVNFGTYAEGNFPEDYELWLRWLEKGVKFYKLPEHVIRWFDRDDRLTRLDERYSDEAFFRIKTKYLANWLKSHNPYHPDVVVWGASRISRKRAGLLKNHGIIISGYIDISRKRQLDDEVIYYQDISSSDNFFVLVYLKEETMRLNTITFLEKKGFVEGKNYLLIA